MKINLQKLATTLQAWKNCVESNNTEWKHKHMNTINELCNDLPSGSGIDNGTKFDHESSNPAKLIFTTSFHHMNDGYYTGWTEHKVIVTPSFGSFNMRITGKDVNGHKDYLNDVFYDLFTAQPMNTVCIRLPKIQDVDFTIECMSEDINPKEELDDETAKRVIEDYENGNEWAWCCIKVTATQGDSEGTDYLGACSYNSKKDFIENSGYYEDMKQTAYSELIKAL